jgi:hypothetical protein
MPASQSKSAIVPELAEEFLERYHQGADATVRLWHAPSLPEAPSVPPIETIRLFVLQQLGTARATLAYEGNDYRLDVTAVDGTGWHVQLVHMVDDLQEGATYTIRFRAKANVPRPIMLYGQIVEPDWHGIGLNQVVSLTEKWEPYEFQFQAKDLSATNMLQLILGERTGTVWITDFTVTQSAK